MLHEIRGFKYQRPVKVLLSKLKGNGNTEFSPVYFHSKIKTVINCKHMLDRCFQEILYRIYNWINEGSGG